MYSLLFSKIAWAEEKYGALLGGGFGRVCGTWVQSWRFVAACVVLRWEIVWICLSDICL